MTATKSRHATMHHCVIFSMHSFCSFISPSKYIDKVQESPKRLISALFIRCVNPSCEELLPRIWHWSIQVTWNLRLSNTWWRYYMKTLSASMAICKGDRPPVDSPQRAGNAELWCDLCWNKLLNKPLSCPWFETSWIFCDVTVMDYHTA